MYQPASQPASQSAPARPPAAPPYLPSYVCIHIYSRYRQHIELYPAPRRVATTPNPRYAPQQPTKEKKEREKKKKKATRSESESEDRTPQFLCIRRWHALTGPRTHTHAHTHGPHIYIHVHPPSSSGRASVHSQPRRWGGGQSLVHTYID